MLGRQWAEEIVPGAARGALKEQTTGVREPQRAGCPGGSRVSQAAAALQRPLVKSGAGLGWAGGKDAPPEGASSETRGLSRDTGYRGEGAGGLGTGKDSKGPLRGLGRVWGQQKVPKGRPRLG